MLNRRNASSLNPGVPTQGRPLTTKQASPLTAFNVPLNAIKVPSAATHLGYRMSIVNSLASNYIATAPPHPRIGRPQVTAQDPERLNGRLHILGKREQQRHRVACSLPKRRSIYFCKTCTSRPALCPSKCFELYHKQR